MRPQLFVICLLALTMDLATQLVVGLDMPFSRVASGTWSGLSSSDSQGSSGNVETYVITDDAAWADLWQRHTANREPAPPRPDVDFGANQVVAVFRFCSSGGYSVKILRIEDEEQAG